MRKLKHSKDKLWLTYTELMERNNFKKNIDIKEKYLPFNYCSLSLEPFEDPVCDDNGNIFEYKYILSYLQKYHKNPINNNPNFTLKNLTKLNFTKTKDKSDNNFICPITQRILNENIKIVAIKETGNVYSYDAYNELNKKINNYKDLLNEKEFSPKNVIIINDPNNKKLIANFAYLKNKDEMNFINNLIYNGDDILDNNNSNNFNNINLPSNYKKLIDDYDNDINKLNHNENMINLINKPLNIPILNKNKKVKVEVKKEENKINKNEDIEKDKFIKDFNLRIKINNFLDEINKKPINDNCNDIGKYLFLNKKRENDKNIDDDEQKKIQKFKEKEDFYIY